MAIRPLVLMLLGGLAVPQRTPPESVPPDAFTAAEKAELYRETKAENRIRLYAAASERLSRQAQASFGAGDCDKLAAQLKLWGDLLAGSLEDADANLERKRKSRNLIRYEIQLRKSIADVRDIALRAPEECREPAETWVAAAEDVRKRFVALLFP